MGRLLVTEGSLRYGDNCRLVVEVDPDLANFYRSLVPFPCQRPRYPPHVTVVRAGLETPPNLEAWGRYEGQSVRIAYDPFIRWGATYLWLNVWCDQLKKIREELGLEPLSEWCLPPGGAFACFHMTLGNMKNLPP